MNGHRSFLFPMLLIGAGVLWLLVNLGYLPANNLWALAHIWPILLIGAGLGLILRQYWAKAGIVISTLIVLGAILAVVYAPQLGWAQMPAWGWWDFNVNGSVAGSHVIVTETREVSGFSAIDIRYPSNVTIQQGDAESVVVTADDNLLPQLATQVSGGTLTVRSNQPNWNRRVNASKTVEITITVTQLRNLSIRTAGSMKVINLAGDELKLDLNGAGSIEMVNLSVSSLEMRLDGAGSVKASGSADQLYIQIDGMSSVSAAALSTQTAEVHISGLGSAEISVAHELTVEIDGAGSVSYHGSPEVHQQVDGLGSVKKVQE